MSMMASIISRLTEITAVAWILVSARHILFWLYFIQLKQYRPDRLWLAVKDSSFLHLLFSPLRLGVYVLFLVWAIGLRVYEPSGFQFNSLYAAVTLFYVASALYQLLLGWRGQLKLPAFTGKILVLFVGILSAEVLLLAFVYRFWPEQLLAIDALQPCIVLAVFLLTWMPNFLYQRYLIKKAAAKRERFKNLAVIGITGSYGKTTMKEYLAHMLSSKYRVLKTPAHINVDTGIAQLVLQELQDHHEMLVVEMGAYRKGEIASICEIVKPTYGVLTALSNQHLELFGSQTAIEEAKFELVQAVDKADNLFANADSPLLVEAFKRRAMNPHWYRFPEKITRSEKMSTFELNGEKYEAPVFATAALTNLAGAITVARTLGLHPQEIQTALTSLPMIERNMQIVKGKKGSTLIDSTYNASTVGVRTALKDLSAFDGYKKIAVFKEVIELGVDSQNDHRLIASDMADTLDAVILLPSLWRKDMIETMQQRGFDASRIYSPQNTAAVQDSLSERTVVLFAGRGGESILERWKNHV